MSLQRAPDDRWPSASDERRTPNISRRASPLTLWAAVLGGPVAFALDRLAGILLVSSRCHRPSGGILGLSTAQGLELAITIVTALIALAAGLVCWRFWSLTAGPGEQETLESMSYTPFLAMGGIWLSAIFLAAIIVTGGLALAISTSCF